MLADNGNLRVEVKGLNMCEELFSLMIIASGRQYGGMWNFRRHQWDFAGEIAIGPDGATTKRDEIFALGFFPLIGSARPLRLTLTNPSLTPSVSHDQVIRQLRYNAQVPGSEFAVEVWIDTMSNEVVRRLLRFAEGGLKFEVEEEYARQEGSAAAIPGDAFTWPDVGE